MLLFMAKAVVIETRICGPTVDPGAASALQGRPPCLRGGEGASGHAEAPEDSLR
jgi:hypothetical protein